MKQVIIFRSEKDGYLYFSINGNVQPIPLFQDNVFKLPVGAVIIKNNTGYRISVIKTTDGIPTYKFENPIIAVAGGGGGGGGIRGLRVEDEGIPLSGFFKTLNFEGAQITVTDNGGGEATIMVGGGGMITGGGTVDRLVMFTAPTIIGDSPFLRSGSDVIADGNMFFASGNGIDVVATGGADVLSIGVNNADVINYGYSGTTHNFSGAIFNESTTNLNIKDKLITINDGGAGGSGGSAGFEIEEGGVATGYFIQNSTRNGFDFQASAITGVATFSLALLTANRTATLQNASGTLAYLSDIPVNAFVQNGNSFGANAVLGTNDVFSLAFETSGTTRMTISATGFIGVNTAPVADQLITATGTGTTSASYLFRGYNSTPTEIFSVRNDGYILAGLANGSMTIGLSAGFNSALANNTALGYNVLNLVAGTGNVGVGSNALQLYTGNDSTAVGRSALLNSSANAGNEAFGADALISNTTGQYNVAIGNGTLFSKTTALRNTAVGNSAGNSSGATGNDNVYIGFNAGNNGNNNGAQNTYIGSGSGTANSGSSNIFLGFMTSGGSFPAVSNRLIIDNGDNAVPYIFGDITNKNLALNQSAWGTNAVGVFTIGNGTAPTTAVANAVQAYSVDSSDNLATLGLFLEQTEAVIGVTVATHKIKVLINGAERYLLISTV